MSKDNKSVQEVKDKVCDYYLSARGCVKGGNAIYYPFITNNIYYTQYTYSY